MNTKLSRIRFAVCAITLPVAVQAQSEPAAGDTGALQQPSANPLLGEVSAAVTSPPPSEESAAPGGEPVNSVVISAPAMATPEKPASESSVTVVDLTEATDPSGVNVVAPASSEKPKDTLSVDFPDEDVRNILRNVADLFELNIVIPDTLQGRTSVKLRDVSWRQIFSVVLSPVNYTFLEEGNIIKVVTVDSLALEPLATEVFVLNYARAEDVEKLILPLINSAGGGRVLKDSRINALIISERPSTLAKITPVLQSLDKATEQVMIESKFIEVTNRDVRNIGVNWASLQNYQLGVGDLEASRTGTRGRQASSGNASEFSNTSASGSSFGTTTGGGSAGTTTSSNGLTQVANQLSSLAKINEAETVNTSVFSAADFNVILSALKTNNETKLVSNPTVVTLNNTEANIKIGEEFPIPNYTYNQERGSFEISGFEYKNIGILLKVTPQVNSAGFIKLLVEPEVSSQAGTTTFGGASGAAIPIIATRKAKTQVTLKDGYTMGIGGLVESTLEKGTSTVPLLGAIPGIGGLFRSKSNTDNGRNLLIFITAKTVSADGAPVGQIFDPRLVRTMGVKPDHLPGYRDGSDPFGPSPAELEAAEKALKKVKRKTQ